MTTEQITAPHFAIIGMQKAIAWLEKHPELLEFFNNFETYSPWGGNALFFDKIDVVRALFAGTGLEGKLYRYGNSTYLVVSHDGLTFIGMEFVGLQSECEELVTL